MPPSPQVRCRQIREADLTQVADLLTRGFPKRARKYWTSGLERLAACPIIEGCPRFGYLLEADGEVVGALLLIFHQTGAGADARIRCNVSSWYVEPAFRSHAPLLVSLALKLKHVTYVNISAAVHTLPMLKAQGYSLYSQGQFVAIPALAAAGRVRARFLGAGSDLVPPERELIETHVAAGCVAVICETDGDALPFLFARRRIAYAPFGVLQLVYCRDTADFSRCAGAIGRLLLARGVLAVLCDADAPLAGLPGFLFRNKGARHFKGPDRPRLNDLSYTELVLFGA
ncbi:MAG: hypothetical protein JO127_19595 [Caulobacteraceae bacterium]|nr:hypothetical protein [Caulobacteraceae bacterium]